MTQTYNNSHWKSMYYIMWQSMHYSICSWVWLPLRLFYRSLVAYLMCQDVDIMTNIAWRCRVLLLSILTLLGLLHLYLTLHVGLFDHFHLQEYNPSDDIHLILCGDSGDVIRTSSLGLMLYSILSAFSLSWRLSIIARRSLEALFYKRIREQR